MAASSPDEIAFRQQVAVDPGGNAIIAWQDITGGDSRPRARMMDADGRLRAIVTLSAPGERAFSPRVAFDASGNPTGAWKRSDGTIQARQGTPGGGLGPIADLSRPDVHTEPELAVDPSGEATVVWGGFDGFNEVVELRRIGPGGPVGEIQNLSAGGEDSEPQVAVDALGNATVVWLHRNEAGFTVQARTVTAGGQLGPTVDVSPVGAALVTPRLATDPTGGSMAAWGSYDGSRHEIAGARFLVPSPPAPTPPAPTPPAPSPAVPAVPAPALPGLAPSLPAPSVLAGPTVTLTKLRPYTAGQPKSKRKRTKGVDAKLTLDRGARLRLLSTTLSYTRRGKARTVKLETKRLGTVGRRSKLRFKLPRQPASHRRTRHPRDVEAEAPGQVHRCRLHLRRGEDPQGQDEADLGHNELAHAALGLSMVRFLAAELPEAVAACEDAIASAHDLDRELRLALEFQAAATRWSADFRAARPWGGCWRSSRR
ncbi:MAG: hypothetical protein ACRDPC_08690 [Solirubrobacteraceae bacterium]